MKLLVVSDNHHDWGIVEKILAKEKYDFSVHLGDAEVPEEKISAKFDKYVAGNHDLYSVTEDVFVLEGIKFGILHGHLWGVSMFSIDKPILKFARHTGAEVVLHGHTHIPSDKIVDGVRIICPGAVANPRSAYGRTYMMITLSDGQITDVDLKSADRI